MACNKLNQELKQKSEWHLVGFFFFVTMELKLVNHGVNMAGTQVRKKSLLLKVMPMLIGAHRCLITLGKHLCFVRSSF